KMEALENRIMLSAGNLDASFGNGGIVHSNIVGHWTTADQIVQDNQGRLVVVGEGKAASAPDDAAAVWVERFLADGSRDPTFGDSGLVEDNWDGEYQGAAAVEAIAGGKLIVGGSVGHIIDGAGDTEFGVARYNDDGLRDTSFGADGLAKSNFGN